MILRALYDLAMREKLVNDPDFRMVNVSYIVTVGEDGTIRGIADVRRPVEGAKGKSRTVPKPIS
ncbi:MAG: hypothetical protein MUF00_17935, partial [Gemmatimonadaceae bacterium]|nr:hypothetical protein [Gemmatimonadaceae bacterium]